MIFLSTRFFFFLTVTHDLDVVVKGSLFLLKIVFWYFAATSCCQNKTMFIAVCLCGHSFSDGCPGLCSGHGRCTLEQNGWRCICQPGWSGPGCSVVMETDCSDGTDNDGGDILALSIIFHLFLSSLPFPFLFFLADCPFCPIISHLFSPGRKEKKYLSVQGCCPCPAETLVDPCCLLLYCVWV